MQEEDRLENLLQTGLEIAFYNPIYNYIYTLKAVNNSFNTLLFDK